MAGDLAGTPTGTPKTSGDTQAAQSLQAARTDDTDNAYGDGTYTNSASSLDKDFEADAADLGPAPGSFKTFG